MVRHWLKAVGKLKQAAAGSADDQPSTAAELQNGNGALSQHSGATNQIDRASELKAGQALEEVDCGSTGLGAFAHAGWC